MLQMNEFKIIGRITHELDLKEGKKASYLNFQVAVPREYRKEQEEQESDFLNATAFSGTAEFINQYFGKGSPIYLSGRIQTGEYTDEDQNVRKTFSLIVERAKFVQSKKEAEAAAGGSEDTDSRGGRSEKSANTGHSGNSGSRSRNNSKSRDAGNGNASSGSGNGGGAARGIPFDPDDDEDLPF